MALQGSGTISISQIRTELLKRGTNSYSLRALSSGAGLTTPDAMSEFYSFEGCYPYGTFYTSFCSGFDLYYRYYDGACGYYDVIEYGSVTCGCIPTGEVCFTRCDPGGWFFVQTGGACSCTGQAYNYNVYGNEELVLNSCYTPTGSYCYYYGQQRIYTWISNVNGATFYQYVSDPSCP